MDRCVESLGRVFDDRSLAALETGLQVPCTSAPFPHLISPASATAGTVPGNGGRVADSGNFKVNDESNTWPAAAVQRLSPCPRGLSPVLYQVMRIPINSLGFSLQVPCTSGLHVPCTSGLHVPCTSGLQVPCTSAPFICGICEICGPNSHPLFYRQIPWTGVLKASGTFLTTGRWQRWKQILMKLLCLN